MKDDERKNSGNRDNRADRRRQDGVQPFAREGAERRGHLSRFAAGLPLSRRRYGQGLARGAPRNHPSPDRHCGPGRNLFRRRLRAGRGRRGAAHHCARARASAHRRHALLLPRALGRALGGPAEGRGRARAACRGDRGARPRGASRRTFGNRPGGRRADTPERPRAHDARARDFQDNWAQRELVVQGAAEDGVAIRHLLHRPHSAAREPLSEYRAPRQGTVRERLSRRGRVAAQKRLLAVAAGASGLRLPRARGLPRGALHLP